MSSPYPVADDLICGARGDDQTADVMSASGNVTVPGAAIAAWTLESRYACGSTPTRRAVSQSV